MDLKNVNWVSYLEYRITKILRWIGDMAGMDDTRNAYRLSFGGGIVFENSNLKIEKVGG